MDHGKISFKPLEESDFSYLESWLLEPHVQATWGNENWEESYEKYLFRISSSAIKQFVILLDKEPIGYIQYYWASKVGDGWWPGVDDTTLGFDFYIGNPKFLGKGLGEKVIKNFVQFLFTIPNVKRVIADPSPKNFKIIHLLQKTGFQSLGEIDTPDGVALLLEMRG